MKTHPLLSALILAVGLLVATRASAANSYVCNTYMIPSSTNMGSYGWVSAALYSGPSCTGSFVGNFRFCSTGATNSACHLVANGCGVDSVYSAAQLVALWQMLASASALNQAVSYAPLCAANSSIQYIYFRAD